jgi:hypothetical protein
MNLAHFVGQLLAKAPPIPMPAKLINGPLGNRPSLLPSHYIRLIAGEHLEARGLHQVFHGYALKSRCKALLSLRQRGHHNRAQQSGKLLAWLLWLNGFGCLRDT